MVRAVLDANVYIAAFLRSGLCASIVRNSPVRFVPVICPMLLGEIRKYLNTPRAARQLNMQSWAVQRRTTDGYIQQIETVSEFVDDPINITPLTRDPEDDYLIALARNCQCDCIVSQDKDLLEWPEQVPPVMTPVDFASSIGLI